MKVRITNIQRFSLHDGPGIRTTVFLKGCNLRCPWCANPENLSYEIQEYYDVENEKSGFFGYDIETEKLESEILKDEKYYKLKNGGVTFSGGEPLLQFDKLQQLLIKLKNRKINICVETALFISEDLLDISMKYVDEYIIDVKILEKQKCKEILNGDIEIYYNNIDKLFKNKKNVIIRIPLTLEYTLQEENIYKILELLDKYKPNKVEVFKVHNLAEKKYKVLNKDIIKFNDISDEEIDDFIRKIANLNINVEKIEI